MTWKHWEKRSVAHHVCLTVLILVLGEKVLMQLSYQVLSLRKYPSTPALANQSWSSNRTILTRCMQLNCVRIYLLCQGIRVLECESSLSGCTLVDDVTEDKKPRLSFSGCVYGPSAISQIDTQQL